MTYGEFTDRIEDAISAVAGDVEYYSTPISQQAIAAVLRVLRSDKVLAAIANAVDEETAIDKRGASG